MQEAALLQPFVCYKSMGCGYIVSSPVPTTVILAQHISHTLVEQGAKARPLSPFGLMMGGSRPWSAARSDLPIL